jgi:hypothetical protein
MNRLFWIMILACVFAVTSCSEDKRDKSPEGDASLADASGDGAGSADAGDAGPDAGDAGPAADGGGGQGGAGGGEDAQTASCEPGTLGCVCDKDDQCQEPAVCVGTMCSLIAVWAPYDSDDPAKETLWWNDQGVWQ